jgi:hypothetical protein
MKALLMVVVMCFAMVGYAESGMRTLAEQNGSGKKTLDSLRKTPAKKAESEGIKEFKSGVDSIASYNKNTILQANKSLSYYKADSKEWLKAKKEKEAAIKQINDAFADRLDSMPDADKKTAKAYIDAQLKALDAIKG